MSSLASTLNYQPVDLRFGTSGRRGRVKDLTQLEIYINVLAELEYLQSLTCAEGGISAGEEVFFAHDLRPSSTGFAEEEEGRGELAQAAVEAIRDAGMVPVNLGAIPTPALTWYALARYRASIMITGSHIPFDLNGYKLNTSVGELLKHHEIPIGEQVAKVRERILAGQAAESRFDSCGMLRGGHRELPSVHDEARTGYIARYAEFFGTPFTGKRVMVYQHSALARDLLPELLRHLGAQVEVCGRSDTFVAIDTEAIGAAELETIQSLVTDPGLFAVVSTDGDSDRPLVLGLDRGRVHFFSGDLLGMIVAEFLSADAVVVPVTCNDAIDRGPLARVLTPRTPIGSPHVVAGIEKARAKGKHRVCGWEANGGFLLGSDIERDGRTLTALPTRDAMLPICAVLAAASERGVSLCELFHSLPRRYSKAALLRGFPRETGRRLVQELNTAEALTPFFTAADGFAAISKIDLTDGVRIHFAGGDVAHFRPSGNADEFRMYAVADTQKRANEIVEAGLAEPDGIVRRMQRAL